MPLYDYECQKEECKNVFEGFRPLAEIEVPHNCPKCDSPAKKLIGFRNTEPTFTDKLYPFYHTGLGEVVHSEKNLKQRCNELGFSSKHEGASMTAKQERWLMSKRSSARPMEIVKRPTWSGRGAHLPTFEVSSD